MAMQQQRAPQRYEGVEQRVQLVALVMILAFSVLCVQLWRLQIVNLARFQQMAEDQRVWPKRLKSDRGIIYGRNGEVLADNRGSADIVLVPGECPKERQEEVCATLERLLGVSAQELMKGIDSHRREPFTQIPIKRDVTKADRVRVEEHSFTLPGVFTVVHPQRRYLHGETGGHSPGLSRRNRAGPTRS